MDEPMNAPSEDDELVFEGMYEPSEDDNDQVFMRSGTIIECDQNAGDDGKFSTTILTTASLFSRHDDVQPSDIEVDVYLPSRKICKGKVLACDFHYNLAVVNARFDAAVQPPKLRDLDDIMSIQPTNQCHPDDRHSTSFKIFPGDYVPALVRSCSFDFAVGLCRFSVRDPKYDCNELYCFSTEDPKMLVEDPSSIVMEKLLESLLLTRPFYPANLVSRWWNSYKNCKRFCRPWLGLNVANLESANFNFLERFLRTFPTVSSGIIVRKVVKKSAAHRSGLLGGDVIVQCNGAAVGSTLDFLDKIWDRVGESVELSILRGAGHVNVKVTVGEATPKEFYSWGNDSGSWGDDGDSEMSKSPNRESSASSSDASSSDYE